MFGAVFLFFTPLTVIYIIYLIYFLYFKSNKSTKNIVDYIFLYTFPVYSATLVALICYAWFILLVIANAGR